MKLPLAPLLFIVAAFFGGCGTGAFQSSAEYQRTDYAKDVKHDIDRQIQAEIFKEPPPGAMGYSASAWTRYWIKQVAMYRTEFPKSKDYQGPSGASFADYIVSFRREHGLPDLPPDGK